MEGLMKGDIAEMEKAIKRSCRWKTANPTYKDFLAGYAVVLCKLAWLKGFEVQVDSPLIPMAFMPVEPLAHYEDIYEFMKPDWQAPPPPDEYRK
ncbi:MAG: Imm49 family immunity protein [Methylococcales bacterium]|nr:Imm49 family immunity protein [Methylococcales bacterium]